MELSYLWVKDNYHIKNQSFNFGSKYLYSHELVGNTVIFSRKENPNHIPGFFKIDSVGFSNITAIVGENGAGKTNLLHYLCNSLLNGPYKEDFVLIFEINGTTYFHKRSTNSFEKPFAKMKTLLELSGLNIEYNFNFELIRATPETISKISLVYYSPIIDFNDRFSLFQNLVNVSSDFLLTNTSNDDLQFLTTHFDPILFYKSLEVKRQMEFLIGLSSLQKSSFQEKISIPERLKITLKEFWTNFNPDIQELRNLPLELRSFFGRFIDNSENLWQSENIEIASRKNKTSISKGKLNLVKWQAFSNFLYNLFNYLLKNANKTNAFYDDSFSDSIDAIRELDFDYQIDYSNYSESEKLKFEQFFIVFLENQDVFRSQNFIPFIERVKSVIFESHVISADENVRLDISIETAEILLKDYLKILNNPFKYENITLSEGFIDFDWAGLSSGEKAYLNLFTRLSLAHKQIQKKTKEHSLSKSREYPENILLLIDEGELGFHLQWQKEYIQDLIQYVSLIFEGAQNIQLIFATHSPISISDLPKENIIFLTKENGKFENPYRATFAANIHEILRNSFFMKNGFMGEFAQHKLNEVIEDLINVEAKDSLSKESIRRIINLVDEPLLKLKLEELYSEKYAENLDIDSIQAQIEYLQNRIQELRQNDNNS